MPRIVISFEVTGREMTPYGESAPGPNLARATFRKKYSGRTAGHVVPGSGTGELAGLTGTVEIAVSKESGHTLALDYELP